MVRVMGSAVSAYLEEILLDGSDQSGLVSLKLHHLSSNLIISSVIRSLSIFHFASLRMQTEIYIMYTNSSPRHHSSATNGPPLRSSRLHLGSVQHLLEFRHSVSHA